MNPLNYLTRPEYVLRPSQTLRRLTRTARAKPPIADVILPWGAVLTVHTDENIGSALYHYGIFDKIVPETLWRLLDRGEVAIEVGANIGQNCSAMAAKAGPTGRVIAFEPHPEVFAELRRNCDRWQSPDYAPVQLERCALGQKEEEAFLAVGEGFAHNRGSAALQTDSGKGQRIAVCTRRLDDFTEGVSQIGVCKIDVEGLELQVLLGAEKSLQRRAVRDIIFEDFDQAPSPVMKFLQQHGFTIFALSDSWLKPHLTPEVAVARAARGFSYNYLATRDAARAQRRFRMPGWHCLLHL
jgi:FkbM family methyltransferase